MLTTVPPSRPTVYKLFPRVELAGGDFVSDHEDKSHVQARARLATFRGKGLLHSRFGGQVSATPKCRADLLDHSLLNLVSIVDLLFASTFSGHMGPGRRDRFPSSRERNGVP